MKNSKKRFTFFEVEDPGLEEKDQVPEQKEPESYICEFCNKKILKNDEDFHFLDCKQNPDNLRVKCAYCKRKYRKSAILAHEIKCKKNPANKKPEPVPVFQGTFQALEEFKVFYYAKIGISHEHRLFNRENLINYFKSRKNAKKYQLYDFFREKGGDSNLTREIGKMVNRLHKKGILRRDKNQFYYLNIKELKKLEAEKLHE